MNAEKIFWIVQSIVVIVVGALILSALSLLATDGSAATVAGIGIFVMVSGMVLWLCVYDMPRNNRGFLKFMGWAIPWSVRNEGPFLFWPFCELKAHSLEPRLKKNIDLDSNTLNGELIGNMSIQLRLPDPSRESDRNACKPDGSEVLLYDRREKDMEDSVKEIAQEFFDELCSGMYVQCAIGVTGKKMNDLFQLVMRNGISAPHTVKTTTGTTKTKVGEELNKVVQEFYDGPLKKLLERQGVKSEPDKPIPVIVPQNDPLDIGLEKILSNEYGSVIQIFTLRIEPSAETQKAMSDITNQQFARQVEQENMEFFTKQIDFVKEKLPNLSDEDVKRVVLTITKEVGKYDISEFVVSGITINEQVMKSLSDGLQALAKVVGQKESKGGGKKK